MKDYIVTLGICLILLVMSGVMIYATIGSMYTIVNRSKISLTITRGLSDK